jgi:hypothetical protein
MPIAAAALMKIRCDRLLYVLFGKLKSPEQRDCGAE